MIRSLNARCVSASDEPSRASSCSRSRWFSTSQLLHQLRQLALFERLPQIFFDPRQILRRHVAAKFVVQQLAIHERRDFLLHQLLADGVDFFLGYLCISGHLLLAAFRSIG